VTLLPLCSSGQEDDGKSGVAPLPRDEDWIRSLELPRLWGAWSPECPTLSEFILWDDFDAFRLAKNDREGSRLCFEVSLDWDGHCGIAVKLGVAGDPFFAPTTALAVLGGTNTSSAVECRVTGRIVTPLGKGELGDDFAERGGNGLNDTAVKESFLFDVLSKLEETKSKFRTVDCLEGILQSGIISIPNLLLFR
jgi:hypothetical protein